MNFSLVIIASFSSLALQSDVKDAGIDSELVDDSELEVLHFTDTTCSSSSPYKLFKYFTL